MIAQKKAKLQRSVGLIALTATGVCSMFGASIYIVPFMIQKNIPGIGQWVLLAFILAAIPALLAAFSYAILSSAMPRAGGSYVYVSRGLHPYLGFIASFSQWFGLSIVIGVIAYIIVPFMRDVAMGLGWENMARLLENGLWRVGIALGLIWIFVGINIRGITSYKKTLLPMMYIMLALASIVILCGLFFDFSDFQTGLLEKENRSFYKKPNLPLNWKTVFAASALLFSSFIGFDSIAQAGGEARNPGKNLPRAILMAIIGLGLFYFLFTASVYKIIPWSFIAEESQTKDVTAPGLLAYILPDSLSVAILLGALIALLNDLPAMLLSVSRLMFSWAEDGIFPNFIARIHPKYHSPHIALIFAGAIASIGVFGSHFASDFFLGIDIMVISMMVNFILMCLTLLFIPNKNPTLFEEIKVFKNRTLQLGIAIAGIVLLIFLLTMNIYKDLTQSLDAWYFHATLVWLMVMTLGSIIFLVKWKQLKREGTDLKIHFKKLPDQ